MEQKLFQRTSVQAQGVLHAQWDFHDIFPISSVSLHLSSSKYDPSFQFTFLNIRKIDVDYFLTFHTGGDILQNYLCKHWPEHFILLHG